MSIEFREAKRADARLLILLAGGTGSGKTESAMRIATGLAGGKPFAVIDTESGRALHKADDYAFHHASLDEPFTPERYADAVDDADAAGYPVVVIDSGSHEYDGPGGVLDIQADEFRRMGERDSARMSSWIVPKRRHKAFVQRLLRSRAHVIMCLRAEDKIEIVKEGTRTVVRPKQSLVGAEGWIPICEKRLPFEATISLLLLQSNPGVPVPVKLERRHADLVPLDKPLDEKVGEALGKWARGGAPKSRAEKAPEADHPSVEAEEAVEASAPVTGDTGSGAETAPGTTLFDSQAVMTLTGRLRSLADQLDNLEATDEAINRNREGHADDEATHVEWLARQVEIMEGNLAKKQEVGAT